MLTVNNMQAIKIDLWYMYCICFYRYYPSEKEFRAVNNKIKKGDIVGAVGKPGNTVYIVYNYWVS